ncbi:MAG TPA: hypothetical protein VF992_04515 [Thermoplasmata archaeon]
MGWHGLLRVVDFQTLLASQPTIAAALDKAQRAGGTKAPEAKALREAYYLLAKVLWTRRASIQRVHDLAWLDHSVVSASARLGHVWQGEDGLRSVASVETIASDPVFQELFPVKGSDWIDVAVQAFAGISPTVKLERGVAGPIRVGLVPDARLKALYDAASTAKFDAPPSAVTVLGEIEALAASARRAGSASVAVVFAASSFEDVPAE